MALTLDSIGFLVEDNEAYTNLRREVWHNGEVIETVEGTYLCWRPGNGIELWSKINDDGIMQHLHPHYSGCGVIHSALVEKKRYEETALAEGCFIAYAKPQRGFVSEHKMLRHGDGTYSSRLPYVFDSPNYDMHADLELPILADVQITAFPLSLVAFESEDEWIDKQLEWDTSGEEDPRVWSGESILPRIVVYDRKSADDFPKPTAFMSATVRKTEIITNPVTDREFSWAQVTTVMGELDVVISPQSLEGILVEEGVIVGEFYLSGHMIGGYDISENV